MGRRKRRNNRFRVGFKGVCQYIKKEDTSGCTVEEADNPPASGGFGGFGGFGAKQAPNPFKGANPEDLDMQDGKVVFKNDPDKGLPLAQAVKGNLYGNILRQTPGSPLDTSGKTA